MCMCVYHMKDNVCDVFDVTVCANTTSKSTYIIHNGAATRLENVGSHRHAHIAQTDKSYTVLTAGRQESIYIIHTHTYIDLRGRRSPQSYAEVGSEMCTKGFYQ